MGFFNESLVKIESNFIGLPDISLEPPVHLDSKTHPDIENP